MSGVKCQRKARDTSAAAESPPINAGHYTIDSASFHWPADTFSHYPAAKHTSTCNPINRQRNSTSNSKLIFISVFPFRFYTRSLLPDSYFSLFSSVIFFTVHRSFSLPLPDRFPFKIILESPINDFLFDHLCGETTEIFINGPIENTSVHNKKRAFSDLLTNRRDHRDKFIRCDADIVISSLLVRDRVL